MAVAKLLLALAILAGALMGSAPHKEPGFTLIGLQVRTNNTREASPDGLIGKQWQKLYGEGLLARIPNRVDSDVIALYTDYAADEHGDYTYILGARVKSCDGVPAGMVCRQVPPGNFVTLESDKGPLPAIVISLWQKVWKSQPADLGGKRAYQNDFELYDGRAADPKDAQIELHLSVQENK